MFERGVYLAMSPGRNARGVVVAAAHGADDGRGARETDQARAAGTAPRRRCNARRADGSRRRRASARPSTPGAARLPPAGAARRSRPARTTSFWKRPRVREDVADAGVAAARDHAEAARVRTSSAWSSGNVSSTRPPGPTIFNEPLQLRSGNVRGTGPVSQTPGCSSTGPSCSMKRPPVASYATLVATIGLASASPLARRDLNIPAATCTRESAAGILRDQRLSQREQPSRVIQVVVAEDHVGDGGEVDTKFLGVAKHGLGSGAGVEEPAPSVDLDDGRKPPLADPLGVGQHRRQHRERQRLRDACRWPCGASHQQ